MGSSGNSGKKGLVLKAVKAASMPPDCFAEVTPGLPRRRGDVPTRTSQQTRNLIMMPPAAKMPVTAIIRRGRRIGTVAQARNIQALAAHGRA